MEIVKPVFRIFDYDKALLFYINWLGFKIDWEYKQAHTPVYLQVSLRNVVLHLSEHHGDATPGARVFIDGFEGLEAYHKELIDRNYKYNKPGLVVPFYDPSALEMTAIDPFGNCLTFVERNAVT